jgi:hypothetical protein
MVQQKSNNPGVPEEAELRYRTHSNYVDRKGSDCVGPVNGLGSTCAEYRTSRQLMTNSDGVFFGRSVYRSGGPMQEDTSFESMPTVLPRQLDLGTNNSTRRVQTQQVNRLREQTYNYEVGNTYCDGYQGPVAKSSRTIDSAKVNNQYQKAMSNTKSYANRVQNK